MARGGWAKCVYTHSRCVSVYSLGCLLCDIRIRHICTKYSINTVHPSCRQWRRYSLLRIPWNKYGSNWNSASKANSNEAPLMTYGIQFTNNNDVVVLDSEFARLVKVDSGSWNGSGSGVYVPFSKTITSAEPPLVFVRLNQSNTLCFCLINGSSGNWTGFSFRGIAGVGTSGVWFAAAFKSEPTANYGFRIWDSTSKLLFDSGTPVAQFTRTISSWSYLGAEETSQGVYRLSWTAYSPLNTGDYMLLNNIAMDVAGSTTRQGNQYAVWDFSNNRLVMQVVGVGIQTTLYTPVVFARLVS